MRKNFMIAIALCSVLFTVTSCKAKETKVSDTAETSVVSSGITETADDYVTRLCHLK